jgi:hypothetical protein
MVAQSVQMLQVNHRLPIGTASSLMVPMRQSASTAPVTFTLTCLPAKRTLVGLAAE